MIQDRLVKQGENISPSQPSPLTAPVFQSPDPVGE